MNKKIIISGGGTGGHIFPAIAIAQAFQRIVPNAEILFVGANGKMEMEKIPQAGFKIKGIDIAGFQRGFDLKNLILPFKILLSFFQCIKILLHFKPDFIVGVGGYVSGPVMFCGYLLGIKIFIQEQNSYAGITNKILSKFAKKIFVAYENMEQFFPKEKIIISGNPVRKDINNITEKRSEAHSFFKLNSNKQTLLILGGSLGARSLNEAIMKNYNQLLKLNCNIIWQCGASLSDTAFQEFSYKENIFLHRFIYRMDLAYAAADLVLSRAGALSISELQITGKPCILVPYPFAAGNHQEKNAIALYKNNAALMVKDHELSDNIIEVLSKLLNDKNMQQSMSESLITMSKKDADEYIATTILNICDEKN